ncbi:MAG: periplasmic heavy metal sensor [Pseudomonadota bacterium]
MTTEGDEIEDGGERSRRVPRWVSVLLVVSLAANLMVVGVFGGLALRGMAKEDDGLNRRERMIQRLLPESHHDAWRSVVAASRPEKRTIRKDMGVVHMRMVTILRTEPFEPDALAQAFDERMALHRQLVSLTGGHFVAMASSMTTAERQVMADKFEEFLERRQRRRAERGIE